MVSNFCAANLFCLYPYNFKDKCFQKSSEVNQPVHIYKSKQSMVSVNCTMFVLVIIFKIIKRKGFQTLPQNCNCIATQPVSSKCYPPYLKLGFSNQNSFKAFCQNKPKVSLHLHWHKSPKTPHSFLLEIIYYKSSDSLLQWLLFLRSGW